MNREGRKFVKTGNIIKLGKHIRLLYKVLATESLRLFNELKEVLLRGFDDDNDNDVNFSKKILHFVKNEGYKGDKNRERILRLASNIENKSDYELKRIYKTSFGDLEMAAGYLLKKRGY